jgi:hypothetical protein
MPAPVDPRSPRDEAAAGKREKPASRSAGSAKLAPGSADRVAFRTAVATAPVVLIMAQRLQLETDHAFHLLSAIVVVVLARAASFHPTE